MPPVEIILLVVIVSLLWTIYEIRGEHRRAAFGRAGVLVIVILAMALFALGAVTGRVAICDPTPDYGGRWPACD